MFDHPQPGEPPDESPRITPRENAPPLAQPREQSSGGGSLPWLIALLLVLLAVLVVPYVAQRIQYAITRGDQLAKRDVALAVLEKTDESEDRLSAVVKVVAPSVVGINTLQTVRGSLLDEWAGIGPRRALGEGSGVIVDDEGYIITNFHVVRGASEVAVQLADGRVISDVTAVGADPYTDLAVLKINAPELVAAKWGDSDDLDVGSQVLAIGNPYGLARTVTYGIVSAKDRQAPGLTRTQDFLQTDAAVNPGNSGGPLVNLDAEIVGINTAIYGEAYRGISFAIPSKIARDVYEKLRQTGRISRGWLGIEMEDVTPQMAEQLGLKQPRGVAVMSVVEGSPADDAGIRRGDVIVAWNGEPVEDHLFLSRAVAGMKPGTQATATIMRGERKREVTLEIGERPMDFGQ
jgi:serine protease Do